MALVRELPGMELKLHPTARVAENATLVGSVVLEEDANIWYGAVLRGDTGTITVGKRSNVQDNCVFHGEVTVGEECTIGHGAIVHACTLGNRVLIGMGATVLSGAVIGEGSIIAAGALVTERTVIPPGSMVMGVPGVVRGPVPEGNWDKMGRAASEYMRLAEEQLPTLAAN